MTTIARIAERPLLYWTNRADMLPQKWSNLKHSKQMDELCLKKWRPMWILLHWQHFPNLTALFSFPMHFLPSCGVFSSFCLCIFMFGIKVRVLFKFFAGDVGRCPETGRVSLACRDIRDYVPGKMCPRGLEMHLLATLLNLEKFQINLVLYWF